MSPTEFGTCHDLFRCILSPVLVNGDAENNPPEIDIFT